MGTIASSRDPSTSPEKPRRVATFREVPGYRPAPAPRTSSSQSNDRRGNSTAADQGKSMGYLDPDLSLSSGRKNKGKGKEKEKSQGGKRYVAVGAGEDALDDLDEDGRGVRNEANGGLRQGEKGPQSWAQ